MSFTVLIPARMASSRLPEKPLADIAGLPMVVRVAQRAMGSTAKRIVVAADDPRIVQACNAHHIDAILTRHDHPSGSDRLAEACHLLGLDGDDVVVNVQGDEPLIDPRDIDAAAQLLHAQPSCSMSTLAHEIADLESFLNPHVVKVVLDHQRHALLFSRAPLPWWRDGFANGVSALPDIKPLRHIGLYAYRAAFLRHFPSLPIAPIEALESLEQLRAMWHGHRIAVHITPHPPGPGVDTPQDLARVRALFA